MLQIFTLGLAKVISLGEKWRQEVPEQRTIIFSLRKREVAARSNYDCYSMYHLLSTHYVSHTEEAFAYITQINSETLCNLISRQRHIQRNASQ